MIPHGSRRGNIRSEYELNKLTAFVFSITHDPNRDQARSSFCKGALIAIGDVRLLIGITSRDPPRNHIYELNWDDQL